jgi:hypothetical protein
MANKTTHKGTTIHVAAVAQNDDLNQAGYEALTWTQVGKVGNPGEFGAKSNLPSYDTLDEPTTQKQKGIADAGSPTIECASIPSDPGQIIMRAFGHPLNADNMAIKWTRSNGQILYSRGAVTGPRYPGGGSDDFVVEVFDVGLNQLPVIVNPA